MKNGLIQHILMTLRLIQSEPVRPKNDYWIVIDDSEEGHKYVCFSDGSGLAYKRRESKFFTKEEAYAMADTLHLKTGHLYHAEPYYTPKETYK